jgi:hypothetical protein
VSAIELDGVDAHRCPPFGTRTRLGHILSPLSLIICFVVAARDLGIVTTPLASSWCNPGVAVIILA